MSYPDTPLNKIGKLSAETLDELEWMLTEEEINHVQWIVGFIRQFRDDIHPCQSKERYELFTEVHDTAQRLKNLLSASSPRYLNYIESAKRIANTFGELAESADPKGKPASRNAVHYRLAEMLCAAIGDERLPIKFRTQPKSDLAQLFRTCCREVGISAPKNAAHYLTGAIESVKLEQEEISRRQEIQKLARRMFDRLREGGDQNEIIGEYVDQANRIQKGAI